MIIRLNDFDEYEVLDPESGEVYYTDDRDDALDTAHHMLERINQPEAPVRILRGTYDDR